jgi:hypothetical protein
VGYLSTKWNGGSWPKGDLIEWFDTGLVKYANVYMQFFFGDHVLQKRDQTQERREEG